MSDVTVNIVTSSIVVSLAPFSIPEAPIDGTTYGRDNAAWIALAAVATSGDAGDLTGILSDSALSPNVQLYQSNAGRIVGILSTVRVPTREPNRYPLALLRI